jgi:hypothetical protein
VTSPK